MERRQTYSYGPARNGVRLTAGCAIGIMVFYILLFITGRYVDITKWLINKNVG